MKKYHSKIGVLFLIPVLISLVGLGYGIYREPNIFGAIILILLTSLMLDLSFRTYYFLSDAKLFIRCGFFTKVIQIDSIRRISDSKNLLSSPALSIDRLEILYNRFDTILISPKEKGKFLEEIVQANPNIEVISKSLSASP